MTRSMEPSMIVPMGVNSYFTSVASRSTFSQATT
eukprot:CAMPEP_0196659966 /NCGR_PEP_ID=MMETSP1086-20130531/37498_1 /TAXON_ID=77921 /ORGANISM="Cyanoptyche  gloeocystis , Strain SAG4.97" /LENGTH=33 /DNA_ID= /DNA_START= /DNA_END= /DNA_ORIENTATION=